MYFVFFSFLLVPRQSLGRHIYRLCLDSEYRRQSLVVFIYRQSPGTINDD
jgi:hypothetical protein